MQRQSKIDLDTRLVRRCIDPLVRMTADETDRARNRVEHQFVVRQRSTAPHIFRARTEILGKNKVSPLPTVTMTRAWAGHAEHGELPVIVQVLTVLNVSQTIEIRLGFPLSGA